MTKAELRRIGPYLNGKVCEVTTPAKVRYKDDIHALDKVTMKIRYYETRLYNADTGEQLNIASITKIEPKAQP